VSDADLIYDRLVAEEKLKSGTKYERLAAIAFRILTDQAAVHDLRLRGGTGVPHQIDVVVGPDRKRALIEAKDYDRTVDLPIVRNFWAVVEDVNTDEAFIVTTKGFSNNAVTYAKAKGITLAVLRPPRDDDWEGLVRRIQLTITATGQTGPPEVIWELHPDDFDKVDADDTPQGLAETRDLKLRADDGTETPFFPLLDDQLHEDYGTVPLGGEGTIGRVNRFTGPTWLVIAGRSPLRVNAWKWSVKVASSSENTVMEGIGGLTAELALRTADGGIRRMFTTKDIQSWAFDGNRVVPRPG